VKFIMWKKALTLVELVISITISSMVLFIVMTFIADSIEIVIWSNKKTEVFNDVFAFKDNFWRFSRWGYWDITLLIDNHSGTWSDILLLTNEDSSKGIIFWVVDYETMQLEENSTYNIYNNKTLWYRRVSQSELIILETTPNDVYNFIFFPDKLYNGLKIKSFQADLYNSWTILDMNMEILLYYNEMNNGILLQTVDPADIININLNF
jgi:hypothetical protein